MGWVYNLKTPDPHSHVPRVIAICLVFPIVAFLAVLLRLYVRIHTKRAGWVDDYASLFSSILAIAYGAIAIAQSRWGLGLDAKYFPQANVVPFSRIQYAGGPVYTLALLGFKVSLLASYLRIGGFVKAYRIVIIAVIVACVCNQLAFTFILCFACHPIARQWDMSIPGSCIDTVASYYALAGTSLAFDCIIIALPLPVLITLRLQSRQKAALVAVFALGFFVTIIQIIRIFTIKNLKTYTDSQPIVLWSVIEISLGVIISCIPTYGPLFHSLKLTSTRRRHPGGSQSYRLTSSSKRPTGYIHGSGSRPFDNSIPGTTIITSTAVERERERVKVSSDGDSEERILAPCAHINGTSNSNSHSPGRESESETTLAELKGMTENGTGCGGIHTMTEVRVESHSLKGSGWIE
ncbi:hypothetical protein Asppvi_008985 [Aspergillus pseudoviridinutans]|uniref:Rhodopsin domain-containing protein n=1 Tax=Aspergillus pseudoviridinutans TaxID=1517512 RepID=A0A9P3BLQ2_9EURO|nr:uncharacterized protein Asppvi_008985 [Aspergillus pseudoviridinutans]GIJ90036.1 hypothetical protein Asppvi_008985 [Aspergillus pseudoviridinutans]